MELIDPIRMIFGLLFTIGLLLALWLGIRKFAPGMVSTSQRGEKRLKLVEALQLDAKRRLIVVRDGTQEHLILLGTSNETILQSRKFTAAKIEEKSTS